MPIRVGVQPVKWFGGLVITQATEVARANIIEIWRRPWEREVNEHLRDARDQRDYYRAEEQRALQACIDEYAPHTAEEFEELAATTRDVPNTEEIDTILDV